MAPSIPDPDHDDPKEIDAFLGLTFYRAQVLEQGIVNLAVAPNAKGGSGVTVCDVESLYEAMDEKTFGQILRVAQRVMTIPSPLAEDLECE